MTPNKNVTSNRNLLLVITYHKSKQGWNLKPGRNTNMNHKRKFLHIRLMSGVCEPVNCSVYLGRDAPINRVLLSACSSPAAPLQLSLSQ